MLVQSTGNYHIMTQYPLSLYLSHAAYTPVCSHLIRANRLDSLVAPVSDYKSTQQFFLLSVCCVELHFYFLLRESFKAFPYQRRVGRHSVYHHESNINNRVLPSDSVTGKHSKCNTEFKSRYCVCSHASKSDSVVVVRDKY